MTQKKICLLGAFAVGKTSLIRRFLTSCFSEQYQTTIGATIEKKIVTLHEQDIALMIWDLYGEDEFQHVQETYLRGSSGYILVCDGTRRSTLPSALTLQQRAESALGKVPFILIINKADLAQEWELTDPDFESLRIQGWHSVRGSAKTGEGVEELFSTLAAGCWRETSGDDDALTRPSD